MSCTARPLTSHTTPTSCRCSWTARAGRETSSRTTCSNCSRRSLAPLLRQLTSQSANELLLDEIDSSHKQTTYWTTTPTGHLAERNLSAVPKKAAVRYVCDKLHGVHSSDKQQGIKETRTTPDTSSTLGKELLILFDQFLCFTGMLRKYKC